MNELERLRAVARAAKALVRTVQPSLFSDMELVSEPALTALETALAAAGYDLQDAELEQLLAREGNPHEHRWARTIAGDEEICTVPGCAARRPASERT